MTVKFAIQIENQFGYSWPMIEEIVTKTEEHGYHSFYVCDHFFLDKSDESDTRDALEAWTILTAAAMITKKIHLGTLVTGNNYRNPALLAKIAASLDQISKGRLEFGIGAGWKEVEYNAYGFEFPSVKDRMDMLDESMEIITRLFREERPSFSGKHFRIQNAVFSPKPQNPMIMIGGGGERRTLRSVAKYADYCNLFSMLDLEGINRKLEILKKHCKDVGREYDAIGKSMFIFGMELVNDEAEIDNIITERATRYNKSETEIKNTLYPENMPGGWIGTPEMLRDRIEFLQTLDFDYFFIQQPINRSLELIPDFANLVKNKYFE